MKIPSQPVNQNGEVLHRSKGLPVIESALSSLSQNQRSGVTADSEMSDSNENAK